MLYSKNHRLDVLRYISARCDHAEITWRTPINKPPTAQHNILAYNYLHKYSFDTATDNLLRVVAHAKWGSDEATLLYLFVDPFQTGLWRDRLWLSEKVIPSYAGSDVSVQRQYIFCWPALLRANRYPSNANRYPRLRSSMTMRVASKFAIFTTSTSLLLYHSFFSTILLKP